METVIIGSGNVAFHLTKAFTVNSIPLKQVFGRNENDLQTISEENNIPYSSTDLADADFYIICVSDSSVSEVSRLIKKENCLVAHTSGSLPKEILEGNFRKASFYPLQTFSKTKTLNYSEIPFFIEAENESDLDFLKNTASKITENIIKSDYEQRKYVHLTAVFSCNFVNHLFARAKEISDSQNIPFRFFLPLIDETVEKIHHPDPKDAQTGPAVRNDKRVLELHEKLLTDEEHLQLYKTLNKSILKMYNLK